MSTLSHSKHPIAFPGNKYNPTKKRNAKDKPQGANIITSTSSQSIQYPKQNTKTLWYWRCIIMYYLWMDRISVARPSHCPCPRIAVLPPLLLRYPHRFQLLRIENRIGELINIKHCCWYLLGKRMTTFKGGSYQHWISCVGARISAQIKILKS